MLNSYRRNPPTRWNLKLSKFVKVLFLLTFVVAHLPCANAGDCYTNPKFPKVIGAEDMDE